jgi:hypothetical protein
VRGRRHCEECGSFRNGVDAAEELCVEASPVLGGAEPRACSSPGQFKTEGWVEQRSEFCGRPTPRPRVNVARRVDGGGKTNEVPVRQHG